MPLEYQQDPDEESEVKIVEKIETEEDLELDWPDYGDVILFI